MYEVILYVLVGSGVLALAFTVVQFVSLISLYNVSKPSHLRIAGRSYSSFNQLQLDVGLGCRLWRNPDLIRWADPSQQQYLASIRRWGMAGLSAWVTFGLMAIFTVSFIIKAVG